MDQIEIVAEDLRGGEHGVARLVEVFYKVLDHGYGSKSKEELVMGDLSAILKWTEAIQAVVEDLAEDEK